LKLHENTIITIQLSLQFNLPHSNNASIFFKWFTENDSSVEILLPSQLWAQIKGLPNSTNHTLASLHRFRPLLHVTEKEKLL